MRMSLRPAVPAAALALLVLLAPVLLAACGGSAVPTIPPGASQPADPTPVGGSGPPGARITAFNLAFDPATLTVPAGEPFTIVFDNRDQGIPHDIVIKDPAGNELVKSAIITGPAREELGIGALEPGTYPFVCTIHPNMVGEITAE